MELLRPIALVILVAFCAYTIYASRTENFWRSLRTVLALKWGRQVTADLYIGLLLFHFFVYFNEGSLWSTLAWLLPSLLLGNIVPLFYFVVNFQSLLSHWG